MRLTLLIPELIWPEPDDTATLGDLPCPTLATLLARGAFARHPGGGATFDATAARCFGLTQNIPYAALRLLGENIDGCPPGTSHWACADPVHLRFHQERLILADGATINISAEEASQLTTTLNQYFADIGEFRAAAPERWYLRLTAEADFQTPPLSAMAGRRVEQLLPEQSGTAWLRKLLNEAQMLLHTHASNEFRADSGRLTINSLWLWGPGQLPPHLESDFDSVWASHPLAKGLARCADVACHDTPGSFAALAAAKHGEHSLVVIDSLLGAVQYEDADAWRKGLQALETDWFKPLAKAIRAGEVTLDLRASTIYGELTWQVGRGDLWRLWKRPQALPALAKKLAEQAAQS